MQELTSGVKGKMFDQRFVGKVNSLALLKSTEQNQANVPQAGLVSNFDPDQRGFLTPALGGYTAVQTDKTGVLTVNPDLGKSPRYQNPDGLNVTFPFAGGRQIRPQPGQPALLYRVQSGSPNASTTYMRGGKAEPYREYPWHPLLGDSTVVIRNDVDFISPIGPSWSSNSPLPPGMRYVELNDYLYFDGGSYTPEELAALYGITVDEIPNLLPHDLSGHGRPNVRPLPGGMWMLNPTIYNDDGYWTGTVKNPLDWNDSFWYGYNNVINKDKLEDYLEAHPGCRFA